MSETKTKTKRITVLQLPGGQYLQRYEYNQGHLKHQTTKDPFVAMNFAYNPDNLAMAQLYFPLAIQRHGNIITTIKLKA